MSHAWVDDLHSLIRDKRAVVLVSVVKSEGSVPREAGARLLVTENQVLHTIGGGHLEWVATQEAQKWLKTKSSKRRLLKRYSLGASLGQCCGGAVTLAFELLDENDLIWVEQLKNSLRSEYGACRQLLFPAIDSEQALDDFSVQVSEQSRKNCHSACEWKLDSESGFIRLKETICSNTFHLVLFGAGHVGRALVKALQDLPCTITWVDQREAEFPSKLPSNVSIDVNEEPESAVDSAPEGCYFLVMTHTHTLDQKLSERILQRGNFTYFGTIGSKTKRQKFEHRMRERGITPEQLERMTCPIGIAGIKGKEPAVIAASVAAELLQVYSAAE